MRTEQEMKSLILNVAGQDARVRAVFMNGSRANPNAPRDIFQDYDIVYVVEETASFRAQPGWVDVFGERLVMQTPDEMDHAAGQPDVYKRQFWTWRKIPSQPGLRWSPSRFPLMPQQNA